MLSNPPWRLDWLDPNEEPSRFESTVWLGDEAIGSILEAGGKWIAYDAEFKPIQGVETRRANEAAAEVFRAWQASKEPTTTTKKPFKIEWDVRNVEGSVRTEKGLIGSITNIEPGNWAAYLGSEMDPFMDEISSANKAAAAVYRKWAGVPEPLPKPKGLDFTAPKWMKGVEIEPVVKMPNRFIVWIDDDRAGIIDRRGRRWDAYVDIGKERIQLEIGTSKNTAIKAVYVAKTLDEYLSSAVSYGKKKSYKPARYKRLPPKKRGQPERRVEVFYRRAFYKRKSPAEIQAVTRLPEKEIVKYGIKLAQARIIFGVITKDPKTVRVIEKRERVIPARGRKPGERVTRRVVTHSYPKRKTSIKAYRFAKAALDGEVGFFGDQS
jgi:hypothetical protein